MERYTWVATVRTTDPTPCTGSMGNKDRSNPRRTDRKRRREGGSRDRGRDDRTDGRDRDRRLDRRRRGDRHYRDARRVHRPSWRRDWIAVWALRSVYLPSSPERVRCPCLAGVRRLRLA